MTLEDCFAAVVHKTGKRLYDLAKFEVRFQCYSDGEGGQTVQGARLELDEHGHQYLLIVLGEA